MGITTDDNPTFQTGNYGNVPWNYHVGQIKAHDDSSPNTKIPGGLRYSWISQSDFISA